ncbi:hypothetical protein [Neobacillus sp. OS1-33]|uniref:hypothetical protein n=1 Tax=Neobacillus sp. OS1-33 TaxID=3070683 RepID=UPI0027E0C139|nr:hypothetical protein [Neobacillus sp. OS1-33]WML26322.1 hypothetical protein RCG22_01350 [Neobacillus sp. OS1-33]
MELTKLFEGMSERYQNLFLFLPVYELNQAKKPKFKELDLMEIGFSILLFILEKMLTDRGNVTNEQLNQFLSQLMKDVYGESYSYEEINELREYIVDEKLRKSGQDFIYEYMDYQRKETQYVRFKLIEYDHWTYQDHQNKEVKLRLTEKGIELLFKTKEYFSEMQISITMLYFKQQLEKGAYSQVLNIAKELLFQIDSQIRAMDDYEEQIKRNVLSAFNQKELETRLQRSYDQTKSERKQIIDLQNNVDRVKLNYVNGVLTNKEKKNYETVLEIDRLLRRATPKHERLFSRKFALLSSLTNSIQMLIENAFSKHFHFEQEIIQNWIEKKVTEEKIRRILIPVMPYKRPRAFNPLRAFQPQVIRKKNNDVVEEIIEVDEEALHRQIVLAEQEEKREFLRDKEIVKMILLPLVEKEYYLISDVLKGLRKSNFKAYTDFEEQHLERFLEISVAMHQSVYKKFELISEEELIWDTRETKLQCEIAREYQQLVEVQEYEMLETQKTYEFLDGTILTDYIIRRKDKENDL